MRRTRVFLLPLVLAFEVGAVMVLHRLGEVPGLGAGTLVAGGAPAEEVLMAAVRLAALALAWWLLATTALCVLAHVCRLPRALRGVEWATLPALRRLVERSVVVTLSLSAVTGGLAGMPAGATAATRAGNAAASDPGAALLVPEIDRGTIVPPAAARLGPAVSPAPARPGAAVATADAGALPRRHRVMPGEHLWGLAAAVVAEQTGRSHQEVPPAEVAAYWVRLVDENPSNLRSGDPDLVFPGEVLVLPALRG